MPVEKPKSGDHPMTFLTIDGRKIETAYWDNVQDYVRSTDVPKKPTLVFLHHGLGCVSTWRKFPERLSAETGCPAFAYSRLSYGKSEPEDPPRPVAYQADQGKDVLPKILEAAGIDDFILIGHSDGGSSSLVYAGSVKKGLRGAIVEAAHVFCEPTHQSAIAETRKTFETTDLREKLARHHGENIDRAFYNWSDQWLTPEFLDWSIADYIPAIECPVLAIRGKHDVYGTRAQMETLKELATCPLETLEPDCGHEPHGEIADEMIDVMARFVAARL
jgi:pimeloyl-ACP methyl ester carboxylesterase